MGVLNIRKPAGQTSRQTVNRVCKLLDMRKVGHCGTLDSDATGVLVVCVGRATKYVERVQALPKTYRTTAKLGWTSPSHDLSTPAQPSPSASEPPRQEVERVLARFQGDIQQRAPSYSALQYKGQRLHKLARSGGPVPVKIRPVTVHEIRLLDYTYPRLTFQMRCGKGTYVRSVVRDLGKILGMGAVVETLERTAIGPFRIDDAIDLELATPESLEAALTDPESALAQQE
jgi:tRNA pseudouridine55 synthase